MDDEHSTSSASRKRKSRTPKLICQLCSRSLDDCLFVDETTKRLTPFCRSCRNVLVEKANEEANQSLGSGLPTNSGESQLPVDEDLNAYTAYLIQSFKNKSVVHRQKCQQVSVGVVPSSSWRTVNQEEFSSTSCVRAVYLYHRFIAATK